MVGTPATVVEMDSGPVMQYSGIEVTVTVMVSKHRVSSSSRAIQDRAADQHGPQRRRTCERDEPRGPDELH